MDALRQSRAELERLCESGDAGAFGWELKCLKAVSRRCYEIEKELETISPPPPPAAREKEKQVEFRDALFKFYEKHNKDKLAEIDKVVEHFSGRVEALNDALLLQYGENLSLGEPTTEEEAKPSPETPVQSVNASLKRFQDIFAEAVQEHYLPRQEFKFRSGTSKSMFGFKDLWIDAIDGTFRLDLCVREHEDTKNGKRHHFVTPELSLKTEKPVKLICRALGVKIVDNVFYSDSPSKGLGKKFQLENVNIDAEVEFALTFWYNKKVGWHAAPSYSFGLKRFKTQRPFIDQILRTVINATVPSAIKRAATKLIPRELGLIMLDHSVVQLNKQKPMGFAMLYQVNIAGWPSTKDFGIDLYNAIQKKTKDKSKAEKILKKIKLTMDQLQTLQQLNAEFSKTGGGSTAKSLFSSLVPGGNKDKGREPWERGVFPLTSISLEELFNLQQGLFVGELVKPNTSNMQQSYEEDEDNEVGTDNEQEDDEMWSGTEGTASDVSDEEEEDDEEEEAVNDAEVPRPISPSKPETAGLAEFKNTQANQAFAEEYSRVISCAAKAQAVAQQRLDEICSKNKVPKWSLGKLMDRVEAVVGRKHLNVELHLHAIDSRLNVDVFIEVLEAFIWKTLKKVRSKMSEAEHNKQLRSIHKGFTSAKLALIALKSLTGSLEFTLTGAVTGGKCPAFEVSVKEMNCSEGVVDFQVGNLRIGGNFKEFAQWFLTFSQKLKSHHVMTQLKRKQSTKALGEVKIHLMRHVELVQFFFDCCIDRADYYSGGGNEIKQTNLILAISAQKDDPRPALSLHVSGEVWQLLLLEEEFLVADNGLDHGVLDDFVFPDKATCTGKEFLDHVIKQETQSLPVVELIDAVVSSKYVTGFPMTKQDAFWVFGFVKYILSVVDPGALRKTGEDLDTDDEEEQGEEDEEEAIE